MEIPLTISFRNMKKSPWVETVVRERVEWLERSFDHIISCRVVVDMPHKHHHQGNFYLIRIDLSVPGKEIVVDREAPEHASAEDMKAVLRDAFDAAKRQLQQYAQRRHGVVKKHSSKPHGRVTQLFADGHGFIETDDGRELYFHSNSVSNQAFEKLQLGVEVTFSEEQGDKGPQASTVRVVDPRAAVERMLPTAVE